MSNATNSAEWTASPPAAPVGPVAVGSSLRSNSADLHSDITDCSGSSSTAGSGGSDIIALLHYRDAYHALGLASPPDPRAWDDGNDRNRPSPRAIQDAYDAAREQALTALDQCEATEKNKQAAGGGGNTNGNGGGRSTFFVSQKNYLELKLQALDQAYEELMPMTEREIEIETPSQQHQLQEEGRERRDASAAIDRRDRYAVPMEKEVTRPPSHETGRDRDAPTDSASNKAIRSVGTQQHPDDEIQTDGKSDPQKREPRRVPSEDDELDTIDIYFRPSPGSKKSSSTRGRATSKSPEQINPSDVSTSSWDGGSSIFSMISRTMQQNVDEASESGLSDMLGIYAHNSSPGRNASPAAERQGKAETKASNEGREDRWEQHSAGRRPPLGIDVKKTRAQISPRSATEFPGPMHGDNHYDNTYNYNTGKAVAAGRGVPMKEPHRRRATALAAASALPNPHEATEAARMGILRALSEENSECLPLDDDYDHVRGLPNKWNGTHEVTETTKSMSDKRQFGKRGGIFQGRSDSMPRENNSLMASTMKDGQSQVSSGNSRSTPTSSQDERLSPAKSLSSAASSSRSRQRRGNGNHMAVATTNSTTSAGRQSTNNHDGADCDEGSLLQTGDYSYDAILQSSMDFADELCVALNSCWRGDAGLAQTLSRAGSVASAALVPEIGPTTPPGGGGAGGGGRAPANRHEEESTVVTDTTWNTRSVYTTDGESTALNTLSSYHNEQMNRNRRPLTRSITPSSTASSDPPPRMLV